MMSSASSSSAATSSPYLSRSTGSSGVLGVTSVPWLQLTSTKRRSYLGQSSGQRHGASGARSRLHFRTVSPFGYVRLSNCLQSWRIGTTTVCLRTRRRVASGHRILDGHTRVGHVVGPTGTGPVAQLVATRRIGMPSRWLRRRGGLRRGLRDGRGLLRLGALVQHPAHAHL